MVLLSLFMHVMRVYNMTLKNKFNPIIVLNNLGRFKSPRFNQW